MRRFGPVFLLASVALLAGVFYLYRGRLERQSTAAPAKPVPLASGLNASAKGWQWAHSAAGQTVVEIQARDFKAVKEPSIFDLAGVELKIFHPPDQKYDRVTSPQAQFSLGEGVLRSDAEVEITMGVSGDDAPPGRLLSIRSSGVTFENKSGRADTDRHATFALDLGEGEADGATYDPQSRELRLKRNVKLIWRGRDRRAAPMYVETGELIYRETDDKVYLMPWTRFRRETLSMTGGPSVLTLEDGNIRLIESTRVAGSDPAPQRAVDFAADEFTMVLRAGGVVEKITGQSNARLTRQTAASRLVVRGRRLDLSFAEQPQGAVLSQALASGDSVAEVIPLPAANRISPETRLLRSETIEMTMRPGGQEIDQLVTHERGTLEFLPNAAHQRRRRLDGERLSMRYGNGNQLESFRGVKVVTRTEPPAAGPARTASAAPQLTWSDDMSASFDPKTGEMRTLEQWGHFRFEEGTRRAVAERGVVEQSSNRILLTGGSRVWDPTGSTEADSIAVDDAAGRTESTGSVRTVREPERPGEEKIRGSADKVTTLDRNQRIRYEGRAVLWQGGNRLTGDVIEIARKERQLRASGNVVHIMRDARQTASEVRAPLMLYRDPERVVFYEGGVTLTRPQLRVTSQKLRAYPSTPTGEEQETTLPDSGLDRAFAEGNVEILQMEPQRRRRGTGQQADFYAADNRVILEGSLAELVESQPGSPQPTVTKGRKLTWQGGGETNAQAKSDKLLVDGAEGQPAVSSLRRKK